MKRLTRTVPVVSAIALVVVVVTAIAWLVATTQGTRWLLSAVASSGGLGISARTVEGRIIDRLLLTEVRIDLTRQKIEIDRLELRWKPLLLLAGTVAIQELTLHKVRVQDDAPRDTTSPTLAWPRVSETARLLDGTIARLQVTDVSYRRLQEQPLLVTSIAASVTWQDDHLSISDLVAVSPSGRIQGRVSTGLRRPSLTADLALALAQPLAGMDRFSLQAGKGRGGDPEPFVGNITVGGSAGTRKLLVLSGDVGMAPHAFNLRRLRLTRTDRNGLITADGSLAFTGGESLLSLQVRADGLNLAPELNVPTDLTGTLSFAGTLDSYRGNFTFANRAQGWQAATVTAAYHGTREGMKLAPVTAAIIDGALAGNLDMDWRDGFALQGALSGRNLNPARLDPAWKGVANFNAAGKLSWSGDAPLTGSVSAALLESRLHGQALTGDLLADFAGGDLSLARLALKGKGFDLHASGELKQRLNLVAQISDFSRLVPGAAGTLKADGWLRWRDGRPGGALSATGSRLAYAGARIADARLTARLEAGAGYPLHVTASLGNVVYDGYRLDAVTLSADGTLQRHNVDATLRSAGSRALLGLTAGYADGIWKGAIGRLAGSDAGGPWNLAAPAAFAVSAATVSLAPLTLTAGAAERLEVAAELALSPLNGTVGAQWNGLNLARANPYLKDVKVSGISRGSVRLGFQPGKRLTLAGSASGSGTFSGQGRSITLQSSLLNVDGNEQGLRVGLDLAMADGGKMKGSFTSPLPFSLAMPERGSLIAELSAINLALLKPWLPKDTRLEGRISGRAAGSMLPGQRFELDGSGLLSGGTLHQQRPDGELNLAFTSAQVSWGWRGEALAGSLSLVMAEYGQARADFQLPIAARLPVVVDPTGPLRATLSARVQEKGIITALFPGLVRESFGALDADLVASGSWDAPQIGGKLRLSRAGAYLPTAGIHLTDLQVAARLEKNLIRIDSFRAVSGGGHIEGAAQLTLVGWRVTGYHGTMGGENFQTVNFPELRLTSSPKLSFVGTPQKLTLRGELHLPELNIVGTPAHTAITPSGDVIREGRTVTAAKEVPFALDVKIRVLLGERVFVKASGVDARLGGAVDLSFNSLDRITSSGEIKVVTGRYRTYGVNLEIVRGRLFFAGGPINRPALDFLALRTIGDVRAGVTVAGTLQKPVTRLYSEPAMPDVDVLAYIVLGHPLGSSGEQAGLVAQAAGALLTSGQAEVLQNQIKNKLGLSTLEVQGGVGGTVSHMGYKPLQVTVPGSMPDSQQPGLTETVLTMGKYLTPQLYISYGKSLFTGSNLFRLRYDIFKNWQIETQTGSGESGVDLYYKLEFM